MENKSEHKKYTNLAPLDQKRFFSYRFASTAGIELQIKELLLIDRIPTLRYLSICRSMLFESFYTAPVEIKRRKKPIKSVSNHTLMREVLLNSKPFRGLTITPKHEDKFYEGINSINRMSLLFIYEELIHKNKRELFLQELKKLGDGLEFVYGSDSEPKVFSEIERFIQYVELTTIEEELKTTKSTIPIEQKSESIEPLVEKTGKILMKRMNTNI